MGGASKGFFPVLGLSLWGVAIRFAGLYRSKPVGGLRPIGPCLWGELASFTPCKLWITDQNYRYGAFGSLGRLVLALFFPSLPCLARQPPHRW